MTKRQLSPYEKTHLARFGKTQLDLNQIGQQPVEYITGKVEFRQHVFAVSPSTLIPRIESEMLVDLALQAVSTNPQPTIAEVGTGCGAIGLSIFLELTSNHQQLQLLLSDISVDALAVAQKNWAELTFKNSQIKIFKSDLLVDFPQVKIDVIVANLPYIPSDRINSLDESVKDFEPHVALDGGRGGLDLIKKLINQASAYLKKNGQIILEVDYTHTEEVLKTELSLNEFDLEVLKDQFHRTRFVVLRKKVTIQRS